jgi:hypothetical protein
MLDIVIGILLCKRLAAMAREKGRSAGWAALGALFWFGGEVTGAVIGAIAGDGELVGTVLGAFAMASVGAVIAYLIVKSLRSAQLDESAAYAMGPVYGAGYQHYDPSNPYSPPRGGPPPGGYGGNRPPGT